MDGQVGQPPPRLEGERFFRQLVENSQGLVCAHDLAGRLLYTSPASARELGYGPTELIGHNLRDLLAPSFQPHFDAYLERISRKGSDSGLLRLRRKDRMERVWAYRNALFTEKDRPAYVIGHALDITDRLQAEESLRRSEERYRAVVEGLEEGLVFFTPEGRISDWNPSAERLLDRGGAELQGKSAVEPDWRVVREDQTPFPLEDHPAIVTLRTGKPCSGVVMGLPRRDRGMIWLEARSQPMITAGAPLPWGAVVSFSDISARMQREQQRERDLQEALARIKILHGILSICASCKRIRDDTGEWQPVEVYVRDHTEADFSHGICPECERRLYADARGPARP